MKIFIILSMLCTCLFAQSSQANRSGKRLMITGSPVGFSFGSPATGFQGAYFLSEDKLIGAGVYNISGSENSGTGIEIFYKSFESNTFYFQPTISYRNIKDDDTFFDFSFSEEKNYRARDIAVGIKIGNQWQFKNFTLGCDWFGYSAIVGNFGRDEEADGGRDFHVTVANFYLGASF